MSVHYIWTGKARARECKNGIIAVLSQCIMKCLLQDTIWIYLPYALRVTVYCNISHTAVTQLFKSYKMLSHNHQSDTQLETRSAALGPAG
jgi:hypothetical protein